MVSLEAVVGLLKRYVDYTFVGVFASEVEGFPSFDRVLRLERVSLHEEKEKRDLLCLGVWPYAKDPLEVYEGVVAGERVRAFLHRRRNCLWLRLERVPKGESQELPSPKEGSSPTLPPKEEGKMGLFWPSSAPSKVIFGLLFGLRIAKASGRPVFREEEPVGDSALEEIAFSRILVMGWSRESLSWRVYHGSYHDYAKTSLHPLDSMPF